MSFSHHYLSLTQHNFCLWFNSNKNLFDSIVNILLRVDVENLLSKHLQHEKLVISYTKFKNVDVNIVNIIKKIFFSQTFLYNSYEMFIVILCFLFLNNIDTLFDSWLIFDLPPGFGKTACIQEITKMFNVCVACPTAQAALEIGYGARTIHSLFKINWEINSSINVKIFDYPPIILDEMSMISSAIFKECMLSCKNGKFILIGDMAQLNPVCGSPIPINSLRISSIFTSVPFISLPRFIKDSNLNLLVNFMRILILDNKIVENLSNNKIALKAELLCECLKEFNRGKNRIKNKRINYNHELNELKFITNKIKVLTNEEWSKHLFKNLNSSIENIPLYVFYKNVSVYDHCESILKSRDVFNTNLQNSIFSTIFLNKNLKNIVNLDFLKKLPGSVVGTRLLIGHMYTIRINNGNEYSNGDKCILVDVIRNHEDTDNTNIEDNINIFNTEKFKFPCLMFKRIRDSKIFSMSPNQYWLCKFCKLKTCIKHLIELKCFVFYVQLSYACTVHCLQGSTITDYVYIDSDAIVDTKRNVSRGLRKIYVLLSRFTEMKFIYMELKTLDFMLNFLLK
jgi:hypothetical protein